MIAVIKKGDLIRPLLLRKGRQPFYVGAPLAVSEEAQHIRHFERIIQLSFFEVGLTENCERRSLLRLEESFHGRKCGRLVVRNHFSLYVSGGEKLEQCSDHANNHSRSNKSASVNFVTPGQQIKSSDSSHDEAPRLHRAEHVVRVLPQRPFIQQ